MKKLCCLRLNTAGVVIGVLYLLAFLYASIHTTYDLVNRLGREKVPRRYYIDTDTVLFHASCVILSVLSFISSTCLVVGSLKNKQKWLIPWLIVGIMFSIGLIGFLMLLAYMYTVYMTNGGRLDLELILRPIGIVLLFVLQVYLWRGIRQLYADITEMNERKKILPTTVPLYPQHEELY